MMIYVWTLTFHLYACIVKCVIIISTTIIMVLVYYFQLHIKISLPAYTSAENNSKVCLSDKSGIAIGLTGQLMSFSQAGSRDWPQMASPRESQPLAITLTVCLHQSTCICWPSNMMSLLISCISLMGSRGEPCPHTRHFLSCCTVGYACFPLGDQLDFFKVLLLLLLFLLPCFISRSFLSAVSLLMVIFALLCHNSSGWKQLHCVCILVIWVLVMISTYLLRYTLNWMYQTFWSTLRFHEQILALCAQISALAFHLKEWCHCVDKLVIS